MSKHSVKTRLYACLAALALFALASGPATAQTYPSKVVKIIVPFPPGGLTDVLARAIGQELTKSWGQQVVVENRPGANTIIAAEVTAKSAPDGYTILMANDPTVSSNQYLYSKLPYDPVKDFAPVINIAETVEVLVASPAFQPKTLAELIAAAKAKPGEITYGSYGLGSKAHLDTEAMALAAGIKLNHVPYKGVADVVPALMSGQVQIGLVGIPSVLPGIRSGKIRAIAYAGAARSPLFPDVPTFAEAGMPNIVARAWFGFIVPAATPRPVIDKIAADVSRVISQPAFMEKFITGVGLNLLNQGPDQFAEFLKADRADYAVRVKNVNVKLD
jgi:tripartite-type tricarboxylate transporter receptor subunit TctC